MKQTIKGSLCLITTIIVPLIITRRVIIESSASKCLLRFLALQDDIGTDILQVYNEKERLIDIPQNSQFLTIANSSINATTLQRGISHWLNFTSWPAWDVRISDLCL